MGCPGFGSDGSVAASVGAQRAHTSVITDGISAGHINIFTALH